MEEWRPIPDFPGYDISNQGQVRSYLKCIGFGTWKISSVPQRILKGAITPTGYRMVTLRRQGKTYGRLIHRLVLLAFNGAPPLNCECAHNDSNPSNNCLTNLRYDTRDGNLQDQYKRRGQLPEQWVPKLRQEYVDGASLEYLSKKYSYSPQTLSNICRGRTHSDCGGPITPAHKRKLRGPDDVATIRQRIKDGEAQISLAYEYGVSESTISRIKSGENR